MSNNLINGVFVPGSNIFVMKNFACADDVTLTLYKLYSISKAFDPSLEYEKAAYLNTNFNKSKDFFCYQDRTPTFNFEVMKQFKRSDLLLL